MKSRILIAGVALIVLPWAWWMLPNSLYYRHGRPTRVGRAVNAFSAWLYSLGFLPSFLEALETTGARSGQPREIPIVIGEYAGEKFIVSMLGERSPWVGNIRAANGQAALLRGGRREIRVVEVPVGERAPILKAYVGRAIGARPHIPVNPAAPIVEFERVAADYPVFRIASIERVEAGRG